MQPHRMKSSTAARCFGSKCSQDAKRIAGSRPIFCDDALSAASSGNHASDGVHAAAQRIRRDALCRGICMGRASSAGSAANIAAASTRSAFRDALGLFSRMFRFNQKAYQLRKTPFRAWQRGSFCIAITQNRPREQRFHVRSGFHFFWNCAPVCSHYCHAKSLVNKCVFVFINRQIVSDGCKKRFGG